MHRPVTISSRAAYDDNIYIYMYRIPVSRRPKMTKEYYRVYSTYKINIYKHEMYIPTVYIYTIGGFVLHCVLHCMLHCVLWMIFYSSSATYRLRKCVSVKIYQWILLFCLLHIFSLLHFCIKSHLLWVVHGFSSRFLLVFFRLGHVSYSSGPTMFETLDYKTNKQINTRHTHTHHMLVQASYRPRTDLTTQSQRPCHRTDSHIHSREDLLSGCRSFFFLFISSCLLLSFSFTNIMALNI